jgi:hypothetical protein
MGYFANGTEGMMFEEAFCSRCLHSDYREGKDFGDKDNPPCPILMAHLMFAYEECNSTSNAKTMLDMLIRPTENFGNECQMFVPRDAGAAIPGQLTLEDG